MSEQQPKFAMPMFRECVPDNIRPWIYVFIAFCFQLSGGRYLGSLNELIGFRVNMREDMLMCIYANLSGMALWFPVLFRMKFRFTNKTLLTTASLTVIVTNLFSIYVSSLPLLWILCFIEGIAKIQGTFECISNIQLWMTPKRDMKIFFPILHVIILSAICMQTLLSAWFGHIGLWQLMHWLIIGLQFVVLFILTTLIRHFRFTKQTLVGIDWIGWILWGALLLQCAFLLDYGEHYDWFKQPELWVLSGTIIITIAIILWKMLHNNNSYIKRSVFSRFRYVKIIFLLVTLYEGILGTEYVLEEVFKEHVLKYDTWTSASLTWAVWGGNLFGCLFSFIWLRHVHHFTYVRLGIIGTLFLVAYLILMYLQVSPELNIEALYFPLFLRGTAYACMSIMFMVSLHDQMDFEHFFQGLSVFNMLHMVVGGCIGCAIYGHALNWYSSDIVARYGVMTDNLTLAIKPIYGWVIYVCLALLLGFLLFDTPLRRQGKRSYLFR